MKEFIEKLMEKYWFKIHYSSIKIFTEQDVRSMIQDACEAQRKACLRRLIEVVDNCDFRTTLMDAVATARITEQDYE